MEVDSVSFAYPDVDRDTRAELAAALRVGAPGPGVFVLSSCLRIEVVVTGGEDRLERALVDLFHRTGLAARGRQRNGEAAIHHLFRVAAGLESPILGEKEILTQFRQAVLLAEGAHSVRGLFAKVLEVAVATGREARELLPPSPHASMAAVAAQLVGGHERIAVLGSGIMASAVVQSLAALPVPPEIVVVARSPEKVALGSGAVWPFDRAPEAIASFPAVVSATSAKHRPLTDADFAMALRRRSGPLTLVDMAMPPDFDPPADAPVRYVDIDTLARMGSRRPRSDAADAMVAAAAAEVHRRVADHHVVSPVIAGLTGTADSVVNRVVARVAGRLANSDDRAVLQQTAHTVAHTLLATPIAYLQSGNRSADAAEIIREAFVVGEQ